MDTHISEGTLRYRIVTCPNHGSRIDVKTGRTIEGARILFLKMKAKDTRSFPVKIEGDDIFIGID
jgi:nitrite reductase/ring-hydroxylating ferredoxin subunit